MKIAINEALKVGYRHFDTAFTYMNEESIGEVLAEWISQGRIKREELFIVTKVSFGIVHEIVSILYNKETLAYHRIQ